MSSRKQSLAAEVPVETEPEALMTCSSPPCFLQELDPAYFGYLDQEEIAALLRDLLAAGPAGTLLEAAWMRSMLRRHLAGLGHVREAKAGLAQGAVAYMEAPSGERGEELARRLREALPRIQDTALRRDLADLLAILERGPQQQQRRQA